MPTFSPGHRLNSGPFGTMGVGLPFGVGAKVACPDKQVIVVHGDGSMGMNAMEMDTAIRHKIPLLIVISLNGGWTGDPKREKPGRDLGYMRYDKMCEAFGGYGEYITKPEDIRPALERAQAKVDEGMVALVNVRTDYRARYARRARSPTIRPDAAALYLPRASGGGNGVYSCPSPGLTLFGACARSFVGQPTRTSVSSGSDSVNSYVPHGLSSGWPNTSSPIRSASSSTLSAYRYRRDCGPVSAALRLLPSDGSHGPDHRTACGNRQVHADWRSRACGKNPHSHRGQCKEE